MGCVPPTRKACGETLTLTARKSVRIETFRSSPLVQGDGEVIGRAPVAIQVIPKALHVIMPRT
jgi:diacylglycerol kinase family enzyme